MELNPTPDKSPLASKTVWGALLLLLAVINGAVQQLTSGMPITDLVPWFLAGEGRELFLAFVAAVMGLGIRGAVGSNTVETRQQVAPPPR